MKTLFSIVASVIFSATFAQTTTNSSDQYLDENGQPFTGIHMEHFPSGELKATYSIEKGELNGEVVYFHSNGQVEERGNYWNGSKDGLWEQWNSTGVKTGEAQYHKGQKDGVWTVWDDNGVQRYSMTYAKDKKVNVWRQWDESGALVSERTY